MPTLRKREHKCTTLGLYIDFLFASSNCTVGGKSKAGHGSSWACFWCIGWVMIPSLSNVDTKWFDAKCQSTRWFPNFWVGVRNGVGEKIALILKGLPPSHHLIGKSHSITNDDVTCEGCGCFQWNYWMPHRKFKKKMKWEVERQIVCVSTFGWMFQPLTNVCLPPTRDDSCWSLFVRVHKFLFGEIRLSSFFKRVTSYFSTKPGSIETNPTLVVEVSNVKLISIQLYLKSYGVSL